MTQNVLYLTVVMAAACQMKQSNWKVLFFYLFEKKASPDNHNLCFFFKGLCGPVFTVRVERKGNAMRESSL